MPRIASAYIPVLPLQLLLRRNPDWAGQPAVVVEEDRPTARLLQVNEAAWSLRVRPGMRYAAALSLVSTLRAGVVPAAAVHAEVVALTDRFRHLTPDVEPASDEPGLFRLNADGLSLLHPSLDAWAWSVQNALAEAGFHSRVVVGFSRFATRAVARGDTRTIVFSSPEQEQAQVLGIALDRLLDDTDLRDALHRLGVRTVGDFVRLPAGGVRQRFGAAAWALWREATGDLAPAMQALPAVEPIARAIDFESSESDAGRLIFLIRGRLPSMLSELVDRGEVASSILLSMRLDDRSDLETEVRPAAATCSEEILLDLVKLRLERLPLRAGVVSLRIVLRGTRATAEQLRLFTTSSRRDAAAADRALARIRAELGDDAVSRARLRPGHLPEARFAWERLERLPPATPRDVSVLPLVRRLWQQPLLLPPRSGREPDGWLLHDPALGPVVSCTGPHIVSGGWWARETHREYWFAELRSGDLFWIFLDRARRRWLLHGRIE